MGKIYRLIQEILRGIFEVIFSRDTKCLICSKEDNIGICEECINKITFCLEKNDTSIGYYKGPLKELIIKFKCKNNFQAGDILVDFLEEKIKTFNKNYIITYIPLSKESYKNRGFNQCEYISKELGYRCNMKVMNTLKRIKEVKIQKTLNKEEREENLKGVFEVINQKNISKKNFILLDDVITTGATVREARNVLLNGGANSVSIITIAKSHI